MKRPMTLALAAAVSCLAPTANAQEFGAFDDVRSERMSNEDAVRVRFTLPFSQAETDRSEPRLSLGFSHDLGEGRTSQLDVLSLNFGGDAPTLELPLAFQGDGTPWYASPMNWVWIGLGVGAAYAIYDASQDDDDDNGPPPPT